MFTFNDNLKLFIVSLVTNVFDVNVKCKNAKNKVWQKSNLWDF